MPPRTFDKWMHRDEIWGTFQCLSHIAIWNLSIHINHLASYLTTTEIKHKILCYIIVLMHPTNLKTITPRRVIASVNLFCTSKGVQWKMTTVTDRMTQCVREVFNSSCRFDDLSTHLFLS